MSRQPASSIIQKNPKLSLQLRTSDSFQKIAIADDKEQSRADLLPNQQKHKQVAQSKSSGSFLFFFCTFIRFSSKEVSHSKRENPNLSPT